MPRAAAGPARTQWIGQVEGKESADRQSSFLLTKADTSGAVLDFHALRVSYISWLVEMEVSVKTC